MFANRFVGHWRLVYCEYVSPDGQMLYPFGDEPRSTLGFDADGAVRVTLDESMVEIAHEAARHIAAGTGPPELPTPDMTDRDIPFAGRYEATETHLVYHIESSPWPAWNGITSRRPYAFRNNRLILSIADTPLPGVVSFIWERVATES
jgi:Lipocalin-like domain